MRLFLKSRIDKSVTLHAVDDGAMRDAGFQEYHIHHPEHGKIGHVTVEHSNEFDRGAGQGHNERLHIAMLRFNHEHRGKSHALAVGVMRALKKKYPTVKEVTGQRITGRHQGWVEHHLKSLVLIKRLTRETAIHHVRALSNVKGRTPEEAATYKQHAAKLMQEHGIKEHEVHGGAAPSSKPKEDPWGPLKRNPNPKMDAFSAEAENYRARRTAHVNWHAKADKEGTSHSNCPYCPETAKSLIKAIVRRSGMGAKPGLGSRVDPMYMPRAVMHIPSGKVYTSAHKDDWHWDIWQQNAKHHHDSTHSPRLWSAGHLDPKDAHFREGPEHTYALRKFIDYENESSKKQHKSLVKANKLDSLTPDEEVLHSIRHNRRAMTHLELADRLIEHIDAAPGQMVLEIGMSLAAAYQENIHVLKHLDKVDQKLGDGLRKIYEIARQADVLELALTKHLVALVSTVPETGRLRDAIANGIRGAIQITHAVDKALKAWAEKNDPNREKSLVLLKSGVCADCGHHDSYLDKKGICTAGAMNGKPCGCKKMRQQTAGEAEAQKKQTDDIFSRIEPDTMVRRERKKSRGVTREAGLVLLKAEQLNLFHEKPARVVHSFDDVEHGKPVKIQAYHGTHAHALEQIKEHGFKADSPTHGLDPKQGAKFKHQQGGKVTHLLGQGTYFADSKHEAGKYGSHVAKVSVHLRKPYVIHHGSISDFRNLDHDELKRRGHDGVVVHSGKYGLHGGENYRQGVAYHPHSVKLVEEHEKMTEPGHRARVRHKTTGESGTVRSVSGGKWHEVRWNGSKRAGTKPRTEYNLEHGKHFELEKSLVLLKGDVVSFDRARGVFKREAQAHQAFHRKHGIAMNSEDCDTCGAANRAKKREATLRWHKAGHDSGMASFSSGCSLCTGAEYKSLVLVKGYKLAYRTEFQGIKVSIENRKGSNRHWKNHDDGTEGKTRMKNPYGYVPGTEAADGDGVDVFLGPDKNATHAFVVRQMKADGKSYDEDKVMLGFRSPAEAKAAYLKHYNSPKFFGRLESYPMHQFRMMLEQNKTRPGPLRAVEVPHYEYGEVI